MSKTSNYKDGVFAIGKGRSYITEDYVETTRGAETWLEGNVVTRYGIVATYSQDGYTRLVFVFGGREYERTWHERFTKRTLTTLAKQFAEYVATTNQ